MKSRRSREYEVFSLSAIDLFASAMGAFLVITLVLLPYYQKEVRSEMDFELVEELAGRTQAELDESKRGVAALRAAIEQARLRRRELASEESRVAAAISAAESAVPAVTAEPVPEIVEDVPAPKLVSFRFLGLKTRQTRFLFLVDMNGYLGQYEDLVRNTVVRAMDSLDAGYEFAIMGFQRLDSGTRYHRWPEGDGLVRYSARSRTEAIRFLNGLAGEYRGSSSVLEAFGQAFQSPARAIILVSDGLPNPEFNQNLSGSALVRAITLANRQRQEVHTVTIGDYFKYQGTVEFMEALASANAGRFQALAE